MGHRVTTRPRDYVALFRRRFSETFSGCILTPHSLSLLYLVVTGGVFVGSELFILDRLSPAEYELVRLGRGAVTICLTAVLLFVIATRTRRR